MLENRRASKRIPFRKRVKFGAPSQGIMLPGYAFNLSEGGVGIKSYRALIPGAEVVVNIFMEDGTLNLEGVVAWTSPYLPGMLLTMGIKFTSRAQSQLERFYRHKTLGVNQLGGGIS
ncbi:MAG: PilZ domain-containing protein [Deltaproteobacteria bacterium]